MESKTMKSCLFMQEKLNKLFIKKETQNLDEKEKFKWINNYINAYISEISEFGTEHDINFKKAEFGLFK